VLVDQIRPLVPKAPGAPSASLLLFEECADGRDCGGRLLFHQPMHGRSSAIAVPNDLSAQIASTCVVNLPLAAKALLSMASCGNAAN
jgi:hypothetical protein